jgi:hypothetical protein
LAQTLIDTLQDAIGVTTSRQELGIIELEAPEWKPHDPQSKPQRVEAHQITSAYLGYLTQQVETGPKTGSQKPNSGPNGALYQASRFIDDFVKWHCTVTFGDIYHLLIGIVPRLQVHSSLVTACTMI